MKTRLFILVAVAGAGLALTGCGDRDSVEPRTTAGNQPSDAARDVAKATDSRADAAVNSAKEAWRETKDATRDLAKDASAAAGETWEQVKDATYDERANFRASMNRMAERIDTKLEDWNAKRSTLSEDTRKAWDRGVTEVREARAKLTEELDDLGEATANNWEKAKEEVAQAWRNLENAYNRLEARMKS